MYKVLSLSLEGYNGHKKPKAMNMLNTMYHRNVNERALGRRDKKVIFILFYLHARNQVSSTSLAGYRKSLWPEMLHRPG